MTTTCGRSTGAAVSGRCRLVLAGVLVGLAALTGCVGRDEATTEEIDQLATTSEALAEDVLAGIGAVAEYSEASTRIGYYSCSQLSPSGSLRFVHTTVLRVLGSPTTGEVRTGIVEVLGEDGWEITDTSRDDIRVATSDAGEVWVHLRTGSSITATIRTGCLQADRDVVANYLERDR